MGKPRGSGERVLKRSWGPRAPAGLLATTLASAGAADFTASSDARHRPAQYMFVPHYRGHTQEARGRADLTDHSTAVTVTGIYIGLDSPRLPFPFGPQPAMKVAKELVYFPIQSHGN